MTINNEFVSDRHMERFHWAKDDPTWNADAQRDDFMRRSDAAMLIFLDDDLARELLLRGYMVAYQPPTGGLMHYEVDPTVPTKADLELSDTPVALTTFDHFWELYPRKIGKKAAVKAWSRLTPAQMSVAVSTIEDHTRLWFHEGRGTRTIPHAATWLNGERWDDELEHVDEREQRKAMPGRAGIEAAIARGNRKAVSS